MARIIKVGAGGDELDWHRALKDLRADDVIMLEPGFYELPQGLTLTDITFKGMGSSPEDTTILGYIGISENSRFVNLENLCINTITDNNSLMIPHNADSYLSLRNCIIKGTNTDTAAIAVNGKATLELYSTKVLNGSISMYAASDFRLEMNDSYVDYPSDEFCALALEGKGTAIINNSRVRGATNTFEDTNMELDINNSQLDYMLLRGQTWLNMLNTSLSSFEDACLYIGDSCWSNIVGSSFNGGVYLDSETRTIIQNCKINRLMVVDKSKLTMTNTEVVAHADFQDNTVADVTRGSFNGNMDYEYFLALDGHAKLSGHNLVLNSNDSQLAIKEDAKINANVLLSDQTSLEIECDNPNNVKIMGVQWTVRKK